ncbi:MAG: gp53-like domain-containing protein [Desulfurivibrionaceae bacterium]
MDYPKTEPDIGLVGGKFTDGDVVGGVPASRDPAVWANSITDELLNIITAAGLTPTEGDNNQVLEAITLLRAAGFAISLTGNGYIKLPTWLGGLILQWGTTTSSSSVNTVVSLPVAYPTAFAAALSSSPDPNNPYFAGASPANLSAINIGAWTPAGARVATPVRWATIGY